MKPQKNVRVEDVVFAKEVTPDGKAIRAVCVAGMALGDVSKEDLIAAIYAAQGPMVSYAGTYGLLVTAAVAPFPIQEICVEESEDY